MRVSYEPKYCHCYDQPKKANGGRIFIGFCSITFRSSRLEVFLRKGVLKICSKFTGEHLYRSVISIKLLCSPVNLIHIFRTPFPKNTSGWLLLNIVNNYFCFAERNQFDLENHGLKQFGYFIVKSCQYL